MLLRFAPGFLARNFTTFSHRTRWPFKEAKYSKLITTEIYKQQKGSTTWTNADSPTLMFSKEPYLGMFFSRTLQDISNRYQLSIGKQVKAYYGVNGYGSYVPEKIFGSLDNAMKLSPLDLRQKCREYAIDAQNNYASVYSKWGILCEKQYSTTDKEYEAAVAESFAKLWKQRNNILNIRYDF